MTWVSSSLPASNSPNTTVSWNWLYARTVRDCSTRGNTLTRAGTFPGICSVIGVTSLTAIAGYGYAVNVGSPNWQGATGVAFGSGTTARMESLPLSETSADTTTTWTLTSSGNTYTSTLLAGEKANGFQMDQSKTCVTNRYLDIYGTGQIAHALLCVPDANAGAAWGALTTIAYTDSVGVFGDSTKDITFSQLTAGYTSPNNARFDGSFMFVPGNLPNGMKANNAFAKMCMYASFMFDLSAYKYRWMTPTVPLTIKIYDGTLASVAVDSAPVGNLLATFTVVSTDFSQPDSSGKFYLSGTKTVTASATGAATYAMLEGWTGLADVPPRLFAPLSTVAVDNFLTLDSLSVTSGSAVTLTDLGFKFATGS